MKTVKYVNAEGVEVTVNMKRMTLRDIKDIQEFAKDLMDMRDPSVVDEIFSKYVSVEGDYNDIDADILGSLCLDVIRGGVFEYVPKAQAGLNSDNTTEKETSDQ